MFDLTLAEVIPWFIYKVKVWKNQIEVNVNSALIADWVINVYVKYNICIQNTTFRLYENKDDKELLVGEFNRSCFKVIDEIFSPPLFNPDHVIEHELASSEFSESTPKSA